METKIEEIWKDVVGYEGYYQISRFGQVKRVSQDKKTRRIRNKYIPPLKKTIGTTGYYHVHLAVDKNHKNYRVHRLVAAAFIPNPENKPCINHIDGNKLNNHVSNLEWCTMKENSQHAVRIGLHHNTYALRCKNVIVTCPDCGLDFNCRGYPRHRKEKHPNSKFTFDGIKPLLAVQP